MDNIDDKDTDYFPNLDPANNYDPNDYSDDDFFNLKPQMKELEVQKGHYESEFSVEDFQ